MQAYWSVHEVGCLFDGDLFHHLWVAYYQNRSVSNVKPGVVYNDAYIHEACIAIITTSIMC